MQQQVKLALIGCGGIAGAHMDGYEKLAEAGYDKFHLAAVCDTNPNNAEAMAKRIHQSLGYQPAMFATVEDMLREAEVDAADICTPHAFHHTAAVPCLRQSVDVMVEKPCGITVKAGKKMLAAAEESGAMVATAEQIRRGVNARAMEWAINEAKVIGEPRFFSMEVMGQTDMAWEEYAFAWRGLKLLGGGGMLLDAGAHFADMMLHVFGPVEQVYAQMRTFFTPMLDGPAGLGKQPLDVEDTWLATLQFASGLVGHWSWSREAPGYTVRSGIYYGDKGSLRDRQEWMHPFQQGADLMLKDGTEISYEDLEKDYLDSLSQQQQEQLFPYGIQDGMIVECWDFIEAVASGRPPEIDGYAALRTKALCFAFYESALAGEAVCPADVESGKVGDYQKPVDAYWNI